MSNEFVSYKCPSCGQMLKYSPEAGKLKCEYCGTEADISGLDALNKADSENTGFDWGNYRQEFDSTKEELRNTVTYICRSCGASIETDEKTVATKCPYCDSDIVVTDKVKGGLKPNLVIPFRINGKDIQDRVREHMKGRKLLPDDFTSEKTLSKIKAIYVPFWMFDAKADGFVMFDATKKKKWSDSENDYVETSHYLVSMDAGMDFVKVPVDGSEMIDDDLMQALEPYDYNDLVEFDPKYLSGFMAERFDESPDESLPKAEKRILRSATDTFRESLRGEFDSLSYRSNRIKVKDTSVNYVLLPVYLLNVNYKGKNYRFGINGQTGKLVGELPIDKSKEKRVFLVPWLISTLVVFGIAAAATLL